MQIDLNHLHHWMQAIRQSNNPMRTMDAFWSGQLKSKEWLIENLERVLHANNDKPMTIEIHGGWVGTLASMLFQSNLPIKHIRSVDVDPLCHHIAEEMNRIEVIEGRFTSLTCDMCSLKGYKADIVINTSTEHLTQEQYDEWLYNTPVDSTIVIQSNNFDIPEHIRFCNSIYELESHSKLNQIFSGTLPLLKYDRYMIIGTRNVSA